MLTQERQSLIKNYVDEHNLVRVTELCHLTATSESTIRRDLIQMAKNGLLKRVHGGAQSVKNLSYDVAQNIRFKLNHGPKLAVAQYAAENLVHAGEHIFIDAGTTTYEMVQFLSRIPDLTVVTNGVETAMCSLQHGLNTILIGGKIKDNTHAIVGEAALRQIKAMNFGASFVGTNGIEANGNLSTPDPEEAAIKMAEIAQAQTSYVLTDNSKIGKRDFAVFAQLPKVRLIVNELNKSQKQFLPRGIKLKEVI